MPSEQLLRVYGDFLFLAFRSTHHQPFNVANLRAAFEPAIELGQYHIFRFDGVPRGLFTFAWLDEHEARSFVSGIGPDPNGWRSGDQLWIMDFIAPYRGLTSGMVRWMTKPGNLPSSKFWFTRNQLGDRENQVTHIDLDSTSDKSRIYSKDQFLSDPSIARGEQF